MRRSLSFALLLLLALVLAVGATACGGGEDETTAPENVEETPPTTTDGETTTDGGETETETEGGETETEGGETTTGETGGESGQGDAAAGKEVFASAGCGGCHTLADAGASGNIGPNLDEEQPDYELALDRVTNGQGAMPSFKDQLSEKQIQDVSAYVAESAGA